MPLFLTPRRLDQRAQFYQQFGQLTAAGVTVVNGLEMLRSSPPGPSFRQPLSAMLAALGRGATVTDAMRDAGDWMPTLDLALIEAGERSGRLDIICKLLASYYTERAQLVRQIIAELTYPAFLLHFAVFLFPFIKFFSDGNLPMYLLKTFGILVPIYAVVGFTIYAGQAKRGAAWRAFLEKILRPVPILGSARNAIAISRLSVALEALINAGIPVIPAWEMAAAASGSPAIHQAVLAWRPQVNSGMTPAEAVKHCPLFPEVFANLYYSGEVSGQLDESLNHLHNYFREEGTRKMRRFAFAVTRGGYFLIVIFVAFKIITFYTGYFNTLNSL